MQFARNLYLNQKSKTGVLLKLDTKTSLGLSFSPFLYLISLFQLTQFKTVVVCHRYKIFGKALDRIKDDSQVCSCLNIYLLKRFILSHLWLQ